MSKIDGQEVDEGTIVTPPPKIIVDSEGSQKVAAIKPERTHMSVEEAATHLSMVRIALIVFAVFDLAFFIVYLIPVIGYLTIGSIVAFIIPIAYSLIKAGASFLLFRYTRVGRAYHTKLMFFAGIGHASSGIFYPVSWVVGMVSTVAILFPLGLVLWFAWLVVVYYGNIWLLFCGWPLAGMAAAVVSFLRVSAGIKELQSKNPETAEPVTLDPQSLQGQCGVSYGELMQRDWAALNSADTVKGKKKALDDDVADQPNSSGTAYFAAEVDEV